MLNLPTGTVTLLFTDIEGSTRLLERLGDQYITLLTECRYLLRDVFRQWNGHEVDTQGDAFFIAFANASDAIAAAGMAQLLLYAHTWPEGVAVRVRIGIHTGEPTLISEGYVGIDVHRAARIMSAGHGGQVLLSQQSRSIIEQTLPSNLGLRDLGEHHLKDLQHPEHLFQLIISNLPADFPPLKTLGSSPAIPAVSKSAEKVYTLAWSPDRRYIASVGKDNIVQVWNAVTGATTSTFRWHANSTHALVWLPDSKHLAAISGDGVVQVWKGM